MKQGGFWAGTDHIGMCDAYLLFFKCWGAWEGKYQVMVSGGGMYFPSALTVMDDFGNLVQVPK